MLKEGPDKVLIAADENCPQVEVLNGVGVIIQVVLDEAVEQGGFTAALGAVNEQKIFGPFRDPIDEKTHLLVSIDKGWFVGVFHLSCP